MVPIDLRSGVLIDSDAASVYVVAVVIIALFVAFIREWRPPEVSAALAVSVLLILGILKIDDALAVLSSPALATIASMFVISAALARTGAINALTRFATARARDRPIISVVLFLVSVALLSAVMNNTPLVILMIPVAVTLAREIGQSASKLLIPLSYAAVLGGTCTLIGTSTNILVAGIAAENGLEPFHIFEIAPLGIVAAVIGIAFLVIGRRFLPDRMVPSEISTLESTKRYIVQAVIEDDSPHVGKRATDIDAFKRADRRLIDVLRGDESLRRALAEVILQPGDVVVIRSPVAEILSMKDKGEITAAEAERLQPLGAPRNSIIAELLVVPGSKLLGRPLRQLRLRRRYGVYPFALHRRGANVTERFETTPLMIGDTLLIEGAPDDLKRLVENEQLVNVTEPETRGFLTGKAPLAIAIMGIVVVGAALGVLPIAAMAAIGAAMVLVTRCVEVEEAVQAVDWRILALIFSMLAIGVTMNDTGLVQLVVDAVAPVLQSLPPIVALAAIYILASVLTELVTNNAVAVILTPIVIGLAVTLGVDPRPFVVTVMFAASMSFMTPIGYQTNTLVYSAGGYRFSDFVRLGAAMDLIAAAVAIMLIPVIWPF